MIPRIAEETLRRLARGFPAVGVTGPRQSGKTTLARLTFPDKPYVTLEDPDTREFAVEDPRGFLDRFPEGAILDEVQRTPELFSYLQGLLDARQKMGQFILTGSSQFGLRSQIAQSLAGRVGMVQLLPFSLSELTQGVEFQHSLAETLYTGMYPPLYDRELAPFDWFPGYTATYIERDLRQLIHVRDLHTFQRFIKMCAARSGQILNLSSLADDCGISHNTAKSWISVLETSFIVYLLQPHYRNFNKRLFKSPKLFFLDSGLMCHLLGIERAEDVETHSLRGAIFETWALSELLKQRYNLGRSSNLYYWRDNAGKEIDIIMERGEALQPAEVKSGRTINKDFFKGLTYWLNLAGDSAVDPTLIYGGAENQERSGITVLGWKGIGGLNGEKNE